MKILIALLVIIAVVWLLRATRKDRSGSEPGSKSKTPRADRSAPDEPTKILQCQHCGVHVPASDCVRGERGVYCTAAHRQAVEF